jgi:hypothetical protein
MKPEKTVPFVAVARWLRLPATGRSGELQRCRQKGCQGSVVWGGRGLHSGRRPQAAELRPGEFEAEGYGDMQCSMYPRVCRAYVTLRL